MTSRVSSISSEFEPAQAEDERRRELEAVAEQQLAARRRITALESEVGAHAAELESIAAMRVLAEQNGAIAADEHADNVPRVQHSISLYATISGIRWDYSKENVIAGVVNTSSAVRDFELDPKTMTRFEITQSLWEMIDSRS